MKFYKIILLTFLFLYSGQICFAGTSVDTLKSATYKNQETILFTGVEVHGR